MHSPTLVAALALFLAPLASRGDELRFAAAEKTSLSKTFEATSKVHSTESKVAFDGEPVSGGGAEGMSVSLEDEMRIEVTDEYLAVVGGRPRKLKRTFEKLESRTVEKVKGGAGDAEEEGGPADFDDKKSSALEGRSVLFTWVDEDAKYEREFAGEKGDDDLLEGLAEDLDFRALLPKKKVAEGDEWEIDVQGFPSILQPGGELKFKSEDGEDSDYEVKVQRALDKHLHGKATGTYKGTREVDGKKLGVIAVAGPLESEADVDGDADEGQTHLVWKLEIEGELLWDPAAGHFRSFEATARVHYQVHIVQSVDLDDKSVEMQQDMTFAGEQTFKASAKAAEAK